jgi:hypothetical protein
MMKSLILAVAVAGVGTFLIPADGGAQGLPAHNSAQTSQHNALTGQVTTHDAAQTSQHNTLSGQATTHDLAQTTQHNALQTAIGNLSTTADHSGLPPTWDKILPANDPGGACPATSSRFKCVMGGSAVRDNETGLVWEHSLSTSTFTWLNAQLHCNTLNVGNRQGWRLPTIQELASLVDPTQFNPALPAGHPFSNVQQSSFYWSATTFAPDASIAWIVSTASGSVSQNFKSRSGSSFVWCVRGGQGVDPQ